MSCVFLSHVLCLVRSLSGVLFTSSFRSHVLFCVFLRMSSVFVRFVRMSCPVSSFTSFACLVLCRVLCLRSHRSLRSHVLCCVVCRVLCLRSHVLSSVFFIRIVRFVRLSCVFFIVAWCVYLNLFACFGNMRLSNILFLKQKYRFYNCNRYFSVVISLRGVVDTL